MIERPGTALLFLMLLVLPRFGSGQQPNRFDPKSYPSSSFHVSRQDYMIGDFTVRVVQAKRIYEASSPPPSYCRAWLQVRKNGRLLWQAYFDDIDPVGSSFGIFLPRRQPLEDYFLALKGGDYDGRLLLVGKDGIQNSFPGGAFFLTADRRYLIGSHASDYPSPFVIDLTHPHLVIDGEKEKLPGVGDWYMDKVGYFFTEDEEEGLTHPANPKIVTIYRLDLNLMKLSKGAMAAAKLKLLKKMDYEPWNLKPDCGSTK